MAWVAELRQHGVTRVALGDFEATIELAAPPPRSTDEGLQHEQHDIDSMAGL